MRRSHLNFQNRMQSYMPSNGQNYDIPQYGKNLTRILVVVGQCGHTVNNHPTQIQRALPSFSPLSNWCVSSSSPRASSVEPVTSESCLLSEAALQGSDVEAV
jgi:hypothetical protein